MPRSTPTVAHIRNVDLAGHSGTLSNVGFAPQCFINKNAKDFLIPQIEEEFSGHDCNLLGKFSDGLGYTHSVLARALEASP